MANAALTGNTATTALVQFDLSWENSWRTINANNWDAAWVFVKYRTSLTGPWLHANLNNTGHTAPTGSQIDLGLLTPGTAFNATTNPVIGTFLSRSTDGTGTFSATGVQLRWNYGLQGLNYADIAEVRVFAIEMVYVPQGAFAAGSGGTETSAFTLTTINTATATTAPAGTGSLGGQAGGFPTGADGTHHGQLAQWLQCFLLHEVRGDPAGLCGLPEHLDLHPAGNAHGHVPTSAAGTGA